MNIKDLTYIVDVEMMKYGELSRGIRYEVCRMAKTGREFTIIVSTDDYTNISANLRRQGYTGILTCKKTETNRKSLTFNASEK